MKVNVTVGCSSNALHSTLVSHKPKVLKSCCLPIRMFCKNVVFCVYYFQSNIFLTFTIIKQAKLITGHHQVSWNIMQSNIGSIVVTAYGILPTFIILHIAFSIHANYLAKRFNGKYEIWHFSTIYNSTPNHFSSLSVLFIYINKDINKNGSRVQFLNSQFKYLSPTSAYNIICR